MKVKPYSFFLGGRDAEMVRIAEVLKGSGQRTVNDGLGWGAKASVYGERIAQSARDGFIPVLVELELDCDVPESTIVVDHHGDRHAEPASLLQVLRLLGQESTRWDTLIAANDSAWFDGMKTVGATAEEMSTVRVADRTAQGITLEQEAEAERALAEPVEMIGDTRVVRMSHSKAGTVGDRLAIEAISAGRPIPAYLVLSGDGEVNFSGDGALAAALKERFEGFSGGTGFGQAGATAFWGGYPAHDDVLAFLRERAT